MTLNPNDYDITELKGVNEGIGVENPQGASGGRADRVLHGEYSRELFRLQSAASEDELEKPYLETVPESYASETTVFEWLEFLVEKAGFKGALEAFQFYRTLNWITKDVEVELRDYVTGLTDRETNPTELDRSDHMLSLVYIARLASME